MEKRFDYTHTFILYIYMKSYRTTTKDEYIWLGLRSQREGEKISCISMCEQHSVTIYIHTHWGMSIEDISKIHLNFGMKLLNWENFIEHCHQSYFPNIYRIHIYEDKHIVYSQTSAKMCTMSKSFNPFKNFGFSESIRMNFARNLQSNKHEH